MGGTIMPLIWASTYLHENHISTMNEYNEDQKKSLALYPKWSKDHTLLSAYFRNPEDFSLTDAGQAIAAQKFGPHATHIWFSYIFQNARTEIIPILAITAIASGQFLEERKNITGVLSIKKYVQKKGTPVLPLARGVRRKVRIWLASSVPKNLEYDLLALVKKYINE